ncbi:MAG: hypothetical protein R3F33_01025 [Planctomycetota bacterium]
MKRSIQSLIPGLLWLLAACGHGPSESPAAPQPAEPEPVAGGPIEVPAHVRKNLGITFTQVQLRPVTRMLRVPGAFETMPDAVREYRAMLPGHVELAVQHLQPVQPDDLLYRLRSPQWAEYVAAIQAAEQELRSAQAAVARAQAAIATHATQVDVLEERLRTLAQAEVQRGDLQAELAILRSRDATLAADLLGAETERTNAGQRREFAAQVAAGIAGPPPAEGYATDLWIEVRAAAAGVVQVPGAPSGAFVETGAAIISTVDPSAVRFHALALQSDAQAILAARTARIVTTATHADSTPLGIPAQMMAGLDSQPSQRTFTLYAVPESPAPWARAGVTAFLEIVLEGTGDAVLAVPRQAIVQDGLHHVLFRRDPKNPDHVLRIEADMGAGDGQWVALESGVMRGDEVVLNGAYELKLASQQSGASSEGGHFHADGSFHGDH